MSSNTVPNYQLAEDSAYNLFEEYSKLKEAVFPIDLSYLIRNLPSIRLQSYSSLAEKAHTSTNYIAEITGSKDGVTFFCKSKNSYIIEFNDAITFPPRIRFTLAHELGHIFLGHLDTEPYGNVTRTQETEANIFARHLLVPFPILTSLRKWTSLPSLDQDDIAFCFDVSNQVANYSIDNYKKINRPFYIEGFCDPFEKDIRKQLNILELAKNIKLKGRKKKELSYGK